MFIAKINNTPLWTFDRMKKKSFNVYKTVIIYRSSVGFINGLTASIWSQPW